MDAIAVVLDQMRSVAAGFGQAVVARLPELLGALALVVVGWLVARWLRRFIRYLGVRLNRGLDRVLRDQRVQRIRVSQAQVELAASLVFWLVLFGFITAASDVAKLETLSGWLERVIGYLPKLLFGALIIVGGYLLGTIARALVSDALYPTGLAQRVLIGRLAQAATFLAAIVIGIDQMGFNVTFVTTMIAIVLGAVLTGFALAFGLGARRVVANLISARTLQQRFSVGHHARIGGVEGEILEFTPTGVILATDEGRVNVPASRFDEEVSVLLSRDAGNG